MPKTNFCKPHNPLPAIKHWMARNGIKTEKTVYEAIGMNHVTWQRRKREPWKFTVEELNLMNSYANFDDKERKELMG